MKLLIIIRFRIIIPIPLILKQILSFLFLSDSVLKLSVFDITGREVDVIFQGTLPAGNHKFKWNGENFPSGVYFYRIEIK